MTAIRAGTVVVALGCVFACGAFGDGTHEVETPGADAGSAGADGAASDGPPGDGPTGPDFCAKHTNALFCADFESSALTQAFTSVDKYGLDTIMLGLTAPPDRELAVGWPASASKNGHRLEKALTMPPTFEVSFELSAVTGIAMQFVEIVDVQSNENQNVRLTARMKLGIVEAKLTIPSDAGFDVTLNLGALPSVPTRYTMKVTGTEFFAQRGSETAEQASLGGAAGLLPARAR